MGCVVISNLSGQNCQGGRILASRKVSDAEIWNGIVQESGGGFIPVSQIQEALRDIHRLQDIFSDELDPMCLSVSWTSFCWCSAGRARL